jgi:Antibiotic biosynthesis monooxygenase
MIHVVAIITAKPGMREAILKEFRANVPAVHAEQGCIEYGPAIDAGGSPAKFGDDTIRGDREVGKSGSAEGPCGIAAYGGLCGQDSGDDRHPRHPRPVTGLKQPVGFALGRGVSGLLDSRPTGFSTGYHGISTALSSCSVICRSSG